MTTTSKSLLIRLREPTDREAWARFVHIYGPLIFRWARYTGLQADDAADLVQDVMTLLLEKLPEFRYDESRSFRSWLKTVTLNKWRERCRRRRLPVADVTQSGLGRLPDSNATDLWDRQYEHRVVSQAMDGLKHDFRPETWEACRRYIFDDAKPSELAQEFGISMWTIYSAKSRLIKKLRDELDGMLD